MTIIVLEGLDGAGKSTVAKMLADALGYQLRHYPVDLEKALKFSPASGTDFAMAVDMVTHPPTEGDWVLDRYYHSHYAYGGRFFETLKQDLPKPDYSFLIDVDPLDSFMRCLERGDDQDISVQSRQDIRKRYHELEFTEVLSGLLNPTELLNTILGITTFNP